MAIVRAGEPDLSDDAAAVTPAGRTPAADGTELLQRMVAEWRLTRVKLGLATAATFTDIARRLDVDRGTAQRLNRISRLAEVGPGDLVHFPGVRAWNRVLTGVERVLGADHQSYQRLSLACHHFAGWLGGSRSAALRRVAAAAGAPSAQPDPPAATRVAGSANFGRTSARARWVDAAAEVVGYGADVRLDLIMARETADGDPRRIDLVTVNVLRGCRGTAAAMPLAFTRVGYSADRREIEGSRGPDPRSFAVLRAVTTKPPPTILSTGDAYRQTVFVEPQWSSMTEPLDLALLHEERAAFPSPWGTPHEWLEFSMVNRHPTRRLVLDRFVTRDVADKCVVSLRAFRTPMQLAHDEPWYDRIPEDAPVVRVGSPADAVSAEPFAGYAAVVAETLARTGWDADDLVVFRAEIADPVPLAMYSILFDRVAG